VRTRDLVAIARLGLVVGDKVTWAAVKAWIRSSPSPQDLEWICQKCPWLPQGYCDEGL